MHPKRLTTSATSGGTTLQAKTRFGPPPVRSTDTGGTNPDGGAYVLHEVTTGLHLADVEQLLGVFDQLVDSGKSVIIIERYPTVLAYATGPSTLIGVRQRRPTVRVRRPTLA